MNKMNKVVKILVPSLLTVLLVGAASLFISGKDFVKSSKNGSDVMDIIKGFRAKDPKELKVYETMHKIANTKIVAEDGFVWGEIEPTQENINNLIIEVTNSNYADKENLLTMLNEWKEGKFSNCIDEHNYLWRKLKGEVGKAKTLRDGIK